MDDASAVIEDEFGTKQHSEPESVKMNVSDGNNVGGSTVEDEGCTNSLAARLQVSNEMNQLESLEDKGELMVEGDDIKEIVETSADNNTSLEDTQTEETANAAQFSTPEYCFNDCKEIARFSQYSTSNSYFVGCKWSPDGSCLLTNCADYNLRLIDLPAQFHSQKNWNESDQSVLELKTSLQMREAGLVYDYAWYPLMSSWNPATCCFICSSSNAPVHLWDAYTGKIRASYLAYDYADEVHAALSLCFSISGEWIYCGFRGFVKIFDVSKPGRQCEVFKLKEISDQKGIVSCISENPTVPELFAVGTYSNTIGLYTRSHEHVTLLKGQRSGFTQLQFSSDGTKLFSGVRKHGEIICWDIRNLGKILTSVDRVVTTNQRIYFDLSRDDKYLISGGTDGNVRVWDLEENINSKDKMEYSFNAGASCVNGVSLHGFYPIIATSSGKREPPELINDEDDQHFFIKKTRFEDHVKLWWAGPVQEM